MSPYMDSFEKELSRVLKESADRIAPPDTNEVWAEIERKIQEKNKKPAVPVFKKFAAAVVLLIFLLTAVLSVTGDYALADFKFFQTVKSVVGNVVNISGVSHGGRELPADSNPEINGMTGEKKLCSLEEAQNLLAYEIAVPGYVPEAYELAGVFVREETDTLSPVELHYIDSSSGKEIEIDENPINRGSAFSYNFRSNDAQMSTIKLNKSEATLIYFKKTDRRKLLWQTSQMYFIVSAGLSEEEIIKLGKLLGE